MTNASDDSRRRLPLRGAVRTHQQIVIAHHLILHGYGHWPPNDPRGSGSEEIRDAKFEPLGPIHHGRKRIQPSRDELRDFHRRAEPLLNFKEGLPEQSWPFVKPYDGWPHKQQTTGISRPYPLT